MKISHLVKVFSVQRDRLEPLRRQASTERRLDIYCYEGESIKRLSRLWTSVQVFVLRKHLLAAITYTMVKNLS